MKYIQACDNCWHVIMLYYCLTFLIAIVFKITVFDLVMVECNLLYQTYESLCLNNLGVSFNYMCASIYSRPYKGAIILVRKTVESKFKQSCQHSILAFQTYKGSRFWERRRHFFLCCVTEKIGFLSCFIWTFSNKRQSMVCTAFEVNL